jgi:hypothetical protein
MVLVLWLLNAEVFIIFKTVRVAVFAEGPAAEEARAAGADVVGGDELIEEIRKGTSFPSDDVGAPLLVCDFRIYFPLKYHQSLHVLTLVQHRKYISDWLLLHLRCLNFEIFVAWEFFSTYDYIYVGGGKLSFDKCIATPMFMPRLSKVVVWIYDINVISCLTHY